MKLWLVTKLHIKLNYKISCRKMEHDNISKSVFLETLHWKSFVNKDSSSSEFRKCSLQSSLEGWKCMLAYQSFWNMRLKTTLGNSNIQGSFSLSTSYTKIEFVNTGPWLKMSMNRLLLYFWNFHKISHLFVKRNTK